LQNKLIQYMKETKPGKFPGFVFQVDLGGKNWIFLISRINWSV